MNRLNLFSSINSGRLPLFVGKINWEMLKRVLPTRFRTISQRDTGKLWAARLHVLIVTLINAFIFIR